MPRDTLLDFLEDYSRRPDVYLVHDDGYRLREATYAGTAALAAGFNTRLANAGISADDKVVI